jgi:hypothetical protein
MSNDDQAKSRNQILEVLENKILKIISHREPPKTMCPSEAPRALSNSELQDIQVSHWRDLMDDARIVAFELRGKGKIEILQKGELIETGIGPTEVKGPIRLRRIDSTA